MRRFLFGLVALATLSGHALLAHAEEVATVAVSDRVTLSGRVDPASIDTGTFVIDLRAADEEHVATDVQAMADVGVERVSLPLGREAPARSAVIQFRALLERTEQPVLVLCSSGNRAGLLWAAHLIERGASVAEARQAVAAVVTRDPIREAIAAYAKGDSK